MPNASILPSEPNRIKGTNSPKATHAIATRVQAALSALGLGNGTSFNCNYMVP